MGVWGLCFCTREVGECGVCGDVSSFWVARRCERRGVIAEDMFLVLEVLER